MVPTAVKPAGFLRRAGLSGDVNGCSYPDNNLARVFHKTVMGTITLRIFYDALKAVERLALWERPIG